MAFFKNVGGKAISGEFSPNFPLDYTFLTVWFSASFSIAVTALQLFLVFLCFPMAFFELEMLLSKKFQAFPENGSLNFSRRVPSFHLRENPVSPVPQKWVIVPLVRAFIPFNDEIGWWDCQTGHRTSSTVKTSLLNFGVPPSDWFRAESSRKIQPYSRREDVMGFIEMIIVAALLFLFIDEFDFKN
jgi:hypothetical protein